MEIVLSNNFNSIPNCELLNVDGGRDWFSYVCEGVFIGGVTAGATVLSGGNPFVGAVACYAAQQVFESGIPVY